MDRYPAFIRCCVLFLAVFYAAADGHLLCAPCLADDVAHHVGHDCGHSAVPMPTIQTATCCLGEFDGGRLFCNGNDLPAVVVPYTTDEMLKTIMNCFIIFESVLVLEDNRESIDFRNAVTLILFAPSLRLHILYGVLVI